MCAGALSELTGGGVLPLNRCEPLDLDFPGFTPLRMRLFDMEADFACLRDWVGQEYAKFWGQADMTVEGLRNKYASLAESVHHQVVAGLNRRTGEHLFFLIFYDVQVDMIRHYYSAQVGDVGVHTLVGPAGSDPVSNMGFYVLAAGQAWGFRDEATKRLVGEPDIRNGRYISRCLQAGHEAGPVMHLPNKSAVLVVVTRERSSRLELGNPPPRPDSCFSERDLRYHMFVGRVIRKIGRMRRGFVRHVTRR
jgi:hypothetical protein